MPGKHHTETEKKTKKIRISYGSNSVAASTTYFWYVFRNTLWVCIPDYPNPTKMITSFSLSLPSALETLTTASQAWQPAKEPRMELWGRAEWCQRVLTPLQSPNTASDFRATSNTQGSAPARTPEPHPWHKGLSPWTGRHPTHVPMPLQQCPQQPDPPQLPCQCPVLHLCSFRDGFWLEEGFISSGPGHVVFPLSPPFNLSLKEATQSSSTWVRQPCP